MYTPIVPVSVEEDADNLIQIFPNPAQGQVTIRTSRLGAIQIYDSKGKLALATEGEKELILNTREHFTPGLFMIKVNGQHGATMRKLVIVE